jgi:hypothetical protein
MVLLPLAEQPVMVLTLRAPGLGLGCWLQAVLLALVCRPLVRAAFLLFLTFPEALGSLQQATDLELVLLPLAEPACKLLPALPEARAFLLQAVLQVLDSFPLVVPQATASRQLAELLLVRKLAS